METDIFAIREFLKTNGWAEVQSEHPTLPTFKKVVNKGVRSQTIVNGQLVNSEPNLIEYTITEIGTGDIEGTPIIGYDVVTSEGSSITVYVYDFQDFIDEIYRTIE